MKRPAVLLGSAAAALVLLTGCGTSVSAESAQGKACKAAIAEYLAAPMAGADDMMKSPAKVVKAMVDAAAAADKTASTACKNVDDETGAQIVAAAQVEAMAKMKSKIEDATDKAEDEADLDMTRGGFGGGGVMDRDNMKITMSGDGELSAEQSDALKVAIEHRSGN